MFPKPLIILSLLAAGALTGCNSDTHSVCVDEQSTTAYGVKWQEDLAAAKHAGKLSMKDVVKLQGRVYERFGLLKDQKYAKFCTLLDDIRKETGF